MGVRTEKEIEENLELWYEVNNKEINRGDPSKLTKTIINTLRWVLGEKPLK